MAEFEVSDIRYKTRNMDAFTQLHVARRLGPIFGGLGDSYKKFIASGNDPLVVIEPIANAVAALRDEDVNYIVNACLDICQREQKGAGASVWANVRGSNGLMFEDIDMAQMIQICWFVLQDALGRFIPALPAGLADKVAAHMPNSSS